MLRVVDTWVVANGGRRTIAMLLKEFNVVKPVLSRRCPKVSGM